MGVKVTFSYCNGERAERVFREARDWYVTDDIVLQIYQEHQGDPEFVIAEYGDWISVEYTDPLPPKPEPGSTLISGLWYHEHTVDQLREEYKRRGLAVPPGSFTSKMLAVGLQEDDEKGSK